MIDFQVSDEQTMIQQTARRILAKVCPREEVRRLDAADEFPAAVVRALGDAGLLGLTIDARYGRGTTQIQRNVIARHLGLRPGWEPKFGERR